MSDERDEILKAWVATRTKAIHDLNGARHLIKLLATSVEGMRQQQSVAVDTIMHGLADANTLLSSIQHKLDEPPP